MIDLCCTNCGHTKIDHLMRDVSPPLPLMCPECKLQTFDKVLLPNALGAAVPDEIPGGIEIRNGICNDDGTPKRYYSYSSMRKAAKEKGLVNAVRHEPRRGSDKSPHTTKWY